MKGDRAFFDTNVLIYAFSDNDPRSRAAEALLISGGEICVQTLNEFVSVAVRKLRMPWEDVLASLEALRALFPAPVPITVEVHESALNIAGRYGYRIYDSLIIAAALRARCKTLYSEDLHSGQRIEGLTIRNPFPSD